LFFTFQSRMMFHMAGAHHNETVLSCFDSGPLLDVNQVALQLNVPPRFVRRLIAEGRIEYVKVGRYVRFRPEQVEAFLNEGLRPMPSRRALLRTSA
jgi:excisionase family DNA binding protein